MTARLPTLAVLALLSGCAALTPPAEHSAPPASAATAPVAAPLKAPAADPATAADDDLDAVLWAQTAQEHDLVYLQTYRDAQSRLLAAKADPSWDALPPDERAVPARGLPPAVILDVDETVLDNSPYQARLVRSGGEFNEADWAAWCKEERARALPGAVAFTRFAARHGIAVIYITNRASDLDEVTLANLRKAGLPVSGPDVFLGLGTYVEGCEQIGSEKGCRRQLVSRKYRVLMQFGDQLGDFVTVLANNAAGRDRAIAPYRDWIGRRWFVLPNPSYGGWQPAAFNNDWTQPRGERRRQERAALRVQ